jgi:hypothetical protein
MAINEIRSRNSPMEKLRRDNGGTSQARRVHEKNPDMEHDDPNGKRMLPRKTDQIVWRFAQVAEFDLFLPDPGSPGSRNDRNDGYQVTRTPNFD